ncbi:cupin domain-containing protein [Pseudonocardia tropica]|uniref:Cupin domain-containing protein n=1 Tax=Pseudonocardia tropica TaxID=681289 RepID=A0ABV1JUT6_9PSEU
MRRHVVRPGEGRPVTPDIVCTVSADDLPGRGVGIIEGTLAPGALIPPHTHAGVDEVTYVLAGEVTAEIGDAVVVAPTGSYLLKPRGLPHAFWNSGTTTARVLELHLPGGFERYYARMAELAADGSDGTDRFARMGALNHEFGVVHHPERIAALRERHGLS